jgi:tRNA1(Val) A37 N6-methylase TrmN6
MTHPRNDLIELEPTGWPPDASREKLVGAWHIYQRQGGHRSSTDDVLTAWMGVRLCRGRPPSRYLDLGCGTGSVLLLTAHALTPAYSLGVEAQSVSACMAARSVRELPPWEPGVFPGGASPILEIAHADLRDPAATPGAFDLVTGSPPYFPVGTGVLSPDAQRRAARFELRGGVEDYCEAAARVLSRDGAFALVFPATGESRALSAAKASALHVTAQADVRMREDAPAPFLTVFGLARAPGPLERSSFAIRRADGSITAEYLAARRALGLAASPPSAA